MTIVVRTTKEGIAKVASLTLIGRGAAFDFRKEGDEFVFTTTEEHRSAFHADSVTITIQDA